MSVPASAGAFPGSVSEGDISGAFLRLNRPRESTKRFSLRFSCAGVNLETENALARASDARSSAYRPARPTHKVHSGAACVGECVATTLRVATCSARVSPDFAKLSECAREVQRLSQMVSARFGRSTRDVDGFASLPCGNFPTRPRPRGGRASLLRTHTARLESSSARERESPHTNGAEPSRASGIASDSRVPSSISAGAPEDEKHVTFSEADDGVGNLRRVPTGGAGELRGGRRGGCRRRHGRRRRCQHGWSSGACPESPERVDRDPRAVSPRRPVARLSTAAERAAAERGSARARGSSRSRSRRATHLASRA